MAIGRRLALVGTGLLLAAPAWADDDKARQDAAFRALTRTPGSPDLDRGTVLLRPWPRGPRGGPWVAAAVARGTQRVGGDTGDLLRVALLEPDDAGFRVLAFGDASAMSEEPLWGVTLDLAPGRWPRPSGLPLVAVALSNHYLSTARSSDSKGLHLFQWDGAALRPVFAALVLSYNYDKGEAALCVERRGYVRPDEGGRQAPNAVMDACDRRHTFESTWTVQAVGTESAPDLVVRDARDRAVSRHRWAGAAYAPAEFRP